MKTAAETHSSLPISALEVAKELLEIDTNHRGSPEMRGLATFELLDGHGVAAASLLLSAIEKFPDDATLWNDLSVAYISQVGSNGDIDLRYASRALDAALQAAELAPARAEPQFNVGVCLHLLGMDAEAREAWRRGAALDARGPWQEAGRIRAAAVRDLTVDADPWTIGSQPWSRAQGNEGGLLSESVRRWPQRAREWVERDALPAWSQAILRADVADARNRLVFIRRVSNAIADRTGDRLLADTVDEMDRADTEAARSLACGFIAYEQGVNQYEDSLREDSLKSFRTAHSCLATVRSTFVLKADLEIAIVLYQLRHVVAARDLFLRIAREAGHKNYVVVAGLANWTAGLTYMQTGEIANAVGAYRLAAAAFDRAGEGQNLAAVHSAAADTLRRIGEHSTGWSFLSRALQSLSDVHSVRRRYTILFNASLYAEDDGLVRTALWFQTSALEAARNRGAANTIIEALARRATLYVDAGDRGAAIQDLDQAEHLLPSVPSASARAYVAALLGRSRGRALIDSDPGQALRLLAAARNFFVQGETSDVAGLFLEEGRAYRRIGDDAEAERHFLDGLLDIERRWRLLSRDDYRVAYLDSVWPLYEALIEVRTKQSDAGRSAFEIADRAKARSLQADTGVIGGLSLDRLQRVLPRDTAVISYVSLKDRLIIWAVAADSWRFIQRPVARESLERQVAAFSTAIEAARPLEELAAIGGALYDLLIPRELLEAQGAGPVVVVPDGPLNTLPFAALLDRRTGRYLVETRTVLLAPSAGHVVAPAVVRKMDTPRPLLVGGRAVNRARALQALPHVSTELREIAALYQSRTVLEDEHATVPNVIRKLSDHNVLHFAGHAVSNDRFPWLSKLMLNGEGESDQDGLSLERLMTLDLSRLNLVVLSACRTASGPVSNGQGVINLMRPFLAAGVPAVVGSLWDVDDASTRALMVRFHGQLVKGRGPVDALGDAQRSLLADIDPVLRHPRSWAAFLVTGRIKPNNTALISRTPSRGDQHRRRALGAR